MIRKLTAGLPAWTCRVPPEKAAPDQRRRLGPAPLQAWFEVVARPHPPGLRLAGLRTVAFYGLNSLKVPGTSHNQI